MLHFPIDQISTFLQIDLTVVHWMKMCLISSELWRHKEHHLGLRFRTGIFLRMISIVSIHLCNRDQMKNLHTFLDFQSFLKTLTLFALFRSTSAMASLTDAIEKVSFWFKFHMGMSFPLFSFGVGRNVLIAFHRWLSWLRRGLLGWKFQSAVTWFQFSLIELFDD